ncbi:MAG TPA: non-homologous end-joining DNA ligase [Candidatus Acidoferrum sp.]|nr:non-homologous end-joining DNA ligase [Candidatus Acidoferrum sp.]
MSLVEYSRKRDFKRTPEPKGRAAAKAEKHRFVVQKHAASHLHYDFRLEMDGALKSWALPKGVPFVKGERRLAVQVEDHPLEYLQFEGTIPKGQYGGGTVMVWDIGHYESLSPAPDQALAGGKLHFALEGKKLKGEWHLVRFRAGKEWLLIKGGENLRPVSKRKDDTSALSGKSMRQLAQSGAVWQSNREQPAPAASAKPSRSRRRAASLAFVEPMMAKLVEKPPPAGEWIYEIKLDGFRALALIGEDGVRLLSRNNKDLGGRFPEVVEALGGLHTRDAIVDGEIVALDEKGRSSFQLLQAAEMGQERPPVFFYAFDLLRLDGADLVHEPLLARKARLEKLLQDSPGLVRNSASLGEDATALLPKARQLGLEGLVGKRKESEYEAGRRSGAWIKLKLLHEQEMVIGGYTDPAGSRPYFGSLVVGYYAGKTLQFAGKVGTGFDSKGLKFLHSRLVPLAIKTCPFANLPERKSGRYGQNITSAEMKRCHWVEPKLVCQVKFAEWTRDDKLRQPVFLGLREDKDPADVVREQAR